MLRGLEFKAARNLDDTVQSTTADGVGRRDLTGSRTVDIKRCCCWFHQSHFRFSLIGSYRQILVSYLLEEDSGSIFILHLAMDVFAIEGVLN